MTEPTKAVTTAEPTKLPAKVKAFEQELEQRSGAFAQALPEHVPLDKFRRNLITAVVQNPKLLDCYRPSLFQAAMTAASLGLLLDRELGHGYILSFREGKSGRDIAQFIPGYRGFIHLARQSDEISSVSAYEVCKNDVFEYELGLNEKLTHKPADGDRGEVTHAYCVVRYKDGGHHLEVLPRAEIDRIRSRSRSKDNGPWVTDYAMMARKSAIRRAAKYMPLSVQRAAALDAAFETGRVAHIEGGDLVIDHDEETGEITQPKLEQKDTKLEAFEATMAEAAKVEAK